MDWSQARIERDELNLLAELVPLAGLQVIELGCGSARLARDLLARHPDARVTGLEVDAIQHARNLAAPAERLSFIAAGAEAIPLPEAQFDLALMLKSLHHVPLALMDQALREVHRVLRTGGHLYVSEPVYAGALNQITRLYNDEGAVRAAAQAALDRALASGQWEAAAERHFAVPVRYADFADFERRMLDVTYAERHLDDDLREQVRARFAAHVGPEGAHFQRPMHVRLLRKAGA
ncbi:MAG TPA: class I SAM-dependent methyltransferase [Ottowia sp.]|uniref:class I SAM-dependent methyltransferase n=1 Tax=Ottowia sp. TaxID=1898956 RepID=UPI002C7DE11C|nr:class I SAM-dependent methyltransferase [Ottowia sp.]MCZ2090691.1 class I SAM-dependent methyltransferase [Burkholderiales bacterium]HNI85250.1 class I SAM-dependent methyltransferase [Ottowia sp.]HNJ44931.1 class I SAM-dependent methyltransferase [Ottowia sp.]HNK52558.1 class I SAM-dependent methyltransferase [Ottowia sp.]HNL41993.1 class I SAM-dependent methyltransferase [Ottowia sp.]